MRDISSCLVNLCQDNTSERVLAKIATKIYNCFNSSDGIRLALQPIGTSLQQARQHLETAEKHHEMLLRYGSRYGTSKKSTDIIHRMILHLRVTASATGDVIDDVRRAIPNTSSLNKWFDGMRRPKSLDEGPRGIIEDLKALRREFPELWWSAIDAKLIAVTDPITLVDDHDESYNMGPMEIRLSLREARNRCHQPNLSGYYVHAREPNYDHEEGYFHPHVSGETLCEGAGKTAVTQALLDCRILDFFTIVDKILKTYSSHAPHHALEDWHSKPCSDCRGPTSTDDYATCEDCGARLCGECGIWCEPCGIVVCSEHGARCSTCEESFCTHCIAGCAVCGNAMCEHEDCRLICAICEECICGNCSERCGACDRVICTKCTNKMTYFEDKDVKLCPECVEDHENEQKEQEREEETPETPGQARSAQYEQPGFTDTHQERANSEGGEGDDNNSNDEDRMEKPGWLLKDGGNLDFAA